MERQVPYVDGRGRMTELASCSVGGGQTCALLRFGSDQRAGLVDE